MLIIKNICHNNNVITIAYAQKEFNDEIYLLPCNIGETYEGVFAYFYPLTKEAYEVKNNFYDFRI